MMIDYKIPHIKLRGIFSHNVLRASSPELGTGFIGFPIGKNGSAVIKIPLPDELRRNIDSGLIKYDIAIGHVKNIIIIDR
jgi:hypothetical protein